MSRIKRCRTINRIAHPNMMAYNISEVSQSYQAISHVKDSDLIISSVVFVHEINFTCEIYSTDESFTSEVFNSTY